MSKLLLIGGKNDYKDKLSQHGYTVNEHSIDNTDTKKIKDLMMNILMKLTLISLIRCL